MSFQGDRSQNVGVVDSEYVFHKAIPTLGGSSHYIIKVFISFLSKIINLFPIVTNTLYSALMFLDKIHGILLRVRCNPQEL